MNIDLLDPRETHHRISSGRDRLDLFLRRLPSNSTQPALGTVLYVHGATFPSALSVAFRFNGHSWRDALCDAGFNVWALDFLGFGFSDRYSEMAMPADASAPLCGASDAAGQLLAALNFIRANEKIERVSIVAHSWGSMPTCKVAIEHVRLIDRIVLFAPIAERTAALDEAPGDAAFPAWRVVTIDEQHRRFVEDVPSGTAPVLVEQEFPAWSDAYLMSDPHSASRTPPSVKVPAGPTFEIMEAWRGRLQYDPRLVRNPVAIVRGAWDRLVTDADARWLFDAFLQVSEKRDIKLGAGTHLMHLETGRVALYQETNAFLRATSIVD